MKTVTSNTEYRANVQGTVEAPLRLSGTDDATQKTHEIGIAHIGATHTAPAASSGEMIRAIHNTLTEIVDLVQSNDHVSYTNKLRILIAQLLLQVKELAKTDRNALKEIEKQLTEKTHEKAELGKSIADQNLKFALFTLVAAGVASYFTQSGPYKLVAETFARDFSPQISKIFEAELTAQLTKTSGLTDILNSKYQNHAQKSQNNSSEKQEFQAALREAFQNRKEAIHG